MSAIAGFYGLDGRLAAVSDIDRMLGALSHRGPDGHAIWTDAAVGLGHRMLRTTPESLHEHLPCKRGNLVITADARIDNRTELIRLLGLGTQQSEALSDSDLILHAYLKWGQDCPTRLLGDFVFSIWDVSKRHLFCARDHFGVKPFYYFYQPRRRFVFATEIKAIFCFSDIPRQLDETKVGDYMLESFEDKARTFYAQINRLPPASMMLVGQDGIILKEYWSLDPKREVRLRSDGEYAEAFRSLFFEAVDCRLRSAFPVGSMLSGGLDSSSVACVARHLAPDPQSCLHTFSIVFDKLKKSDERKYIGSVLGQHKFTPHFIGGDEVTPFDDLDRVLWFQDEPFYAPNFSLSRSAWRSASESGVRILLDGLLGDNVVSHGVEYLNELANRWRWLALARELKRIIEKSNTDISLYQPLRRYFVHEGIKPYVPEIGLRAWRRLHKNPVDPTTNQCAIFRPEYCSRSKILGRLSSAYKYNRKTRASRQAHHDSLNSGMVQTALETYNKGCSEFAVETRFPFIDKRLVEYCLAIPGTQKISQGYTRIIVRRALKGYLPEDIRWRTDKGDLGWSFINGLNAKQDLVDITMESSLRFLNRFFDVRRLGDMQSRRKNGKVIAEELLALFLVTVLSAWSSKGYAR